MKKSRTFAQRVGENLSMLRKTKSDLSQAKLAEKAGLGLRSVNRWESGKSMPSARNLDRLAKILHCVLDDFLK